MEIKGLYSDAELLSPCKNFCWERGLSKYMYIHNTHSQSHNFIAALLDTTACGFLLPHLAHHPRVVGESWLLLQLVENPLILSDSMTHSYP